MPDPVSLAMLAVMMVGLVVGDATFFGNAIHVSIAVPSKLSDKGFSEATAEEAYASELTRLDRLGASVIPMQHVRINAHPGPLYAVAGPLDLSELVRSLQTEVRSDLVLVDGSIVADTSSPALNLVLTVMNADHPGHTVNLAEPDGDPLALVRQGARATLEQLAPYRVALADFSAGLAGDKQALQRSEAEVDRALTKPVDPQMASQWAMMHNLRALMALLANNSAAAAQQLALADQVPGTLPVAHVIITLNRAFLAVANRQPVEAARYYQTALSLCQSINVPPDLATRINELGAIIAWSDGDTRYAAQLFRSVIAAEPLTNQANVYLTEMLAVQGSATPAQLEPETATTHSGGGHDIFALAQTVFHVDVIHGGVKRWSD